MSVIVVSKQDNIIKIMQWFQLRLKYYKCYNIFIKWT